MNLAISLFFGWYIFEHRASTCATMWKLLRPENITRACTQTTCARARAHTHTHTHTSARMLMW